MAAKKIRIDLDPQGPITFERVVQIPTPDGKGIGLPVTYLYRDREAMAKWRLARGTAPVVGGDEPENMVAVAQRTNENDADAIMDMMTDWGVEDIPLTRENVIKLLHLYQGAALAILLDYYKSCIEGRLGN